MANSYDVRRIETERLALEGVVDYIARNNYPPTLRELAESLGPGWSKSKCSDTLNRLARKGYVSLGGEGNGRAIRVLKPADLLDLELAELEGTRAPAGESPA